MSNQPDPDKNVLHPESGLFSREELDGVGFDLADHDDDYDDDDWDDDDYDESGAYSAGYNQGREETIGYFRSLPFVAAIQDTRIFLRRLKFALKWKLSDFRRALRGKKTDDLDIPF